MARTAAILLTALIGLSGFGVGVGLITSLMSTAGGVPDVGYVIGGGIAAYGVAALVGAYATWVGNLVGWWLAVVTIAAGLVLLTVLGTRVAGLDEVFLGGAVLWGADLLALVSEGTRRSLRPRERRTG